MTNVIHDAACCWLSTCPTTSIYYVIILQEAFFQNSGDFWHHFFLSRKLVFLQEIIPAVPLGNPAEPGASKLIISFP